MPSWPPFYKASGQMFEILDLLGNPETKLPPVLHLTGTNGKGSSAAFLAALLQSQDKIIHKFTSPHLLHFNENFIIANQQLSDNEIEDLTIEIRTKLDDKIKPSFFEFSTALAFLAASRKPADYFILECGMGAKTDPTNVIADNCLSIITPISYDHQEFLGESLAEITLDKCHIMKGGPVISAAQNEEAHFVISEFCKLRNLPLYLAEQNYSYEIKGDNFVFNDLDNGDLYELIRPQALLGKHQEQNLATALAALTKLNLELNLSSLKTAIISCRWLGRLELFRIESNKEVWFDGAHNEAGAEAVATWLSQQDSAYQNILIYGRSAANDHKKFLEHFGEDTQKYFVTVQNEAEPETAANFRNFLQKHPELSMEIRDNLSEILDELLARPEKLRILICGSLYLYRDLVKWRGL